MSEIIPINDPSELPHGSLLYTASLDVAEKFARDERPIYAWTRTIKKQYTEYYVVKVNLPEAVK